MGRGVCTAGKPEAKTSSASEQRGAGFRRDPHTYSLAPKPATLGQAPSLGGLGPSCFSLPQPRGASLELWERELRAQL